MTAVVLLRPLFALLLSGGAVSVLLLQPGDVLVPAVLAGVGLRLWCGLPELRSMGAVHRTDVLVEVVGGVAVTLLAVLAARGTRALPVEATLVSLGALLLLLAPVLRLLRR
jgi:hypothetical protein